MPDRIEFTCSACGRAATDPEAERPGWAAVAGFGDCVAWLNDEADHPGYLLKEASPIPGTVYRLRVSYPFRAEVGHAFWAMFRPWMIAMNGWDDGSAADLARSGLARCVWSGLVEPGDDGATVIAVEVVDFVPFDAIEARLGCGPRPDDPLDLDLFGFHVDPTVVRGDVSVHVAHFQGDGNSYVLCRHDGGARRVTLAGFWDWHEDYVFAGSHPVSEDEWSTLAGAPSQSSPG